MYCHAATLLSELCAGQHSPVQTIMLQPMFVVSWAECKLLVLLNPSTKDMQARPVRLLLLCLAMLLNAMPGNVFRHFTAWYVGVCHAFATAYFVVSGLAGLKLGSACMSLFRDALALIAQMIA